MALSMAARRAKAPAGPTPIELRVLLHVSKARRNGKDGLSRIDHRSCLAAGWLQLDSLGCCLSPAGEAVVRGFGGMP